MKNIWPLVLFCIVAVVPTLQAGGGPVYPPLSEQEAADFNNQIQDQVDIAQAKLNELIQEMNNPNVLMSASLKIEIKRIAEMVKVKEILASEFAGKQSLRSPLVRSTLLAVMQKTIVSSEDLSHLQQVVDSEKANIRTYDEHEARLQRATQSDDSKKRMDAREADLDRRERELEKREAAGTQPALSK